MGSVSWVPKEPLKSELEAVEGLDARKEQTAAEASQGYIHSQAIVDSTEVGEGTRVWAFSHVMAGASVGRSCNIGEGCFIEDGARLGNYVTLKNGVAVWTGVGIEDYAFIGPNVVFTNDLRPRAWIKPPQFAETRIGRGVSIGANSTIVCGGYPGQVWYGRRRLSGHPGY